MTRIQIGLRSSGQRRPLACSFRQLAGNPLELLTKKSRMHSASRRMRLASGLWCPELNFTFPNPRQSPQSAKGESCAPRRDVKYAPEAHLFLASSKGLLDPP